jgi:hypothetical protein
MITKVYAHECDLLVLVSEGCLKIRSNRMIEDGFHRRRLAQTTNRIRRGTPDPLVRIDRRFDQRIKSSGVGGVAKSLR